VQSDTVGYDRARDSLAPRLPYIPYRATHKTETTFSPQTIPQNCTNSAPLLCCFLGQTNSHLDSHLPVFPPLQTLPFCVLETSSLPQQPRNHLERQHNHKLQHVRRYPPEQAADFPQAELQRCHHRRLQSQVAYRRCSSPALDGPQ
jgi:predicted glycoside hydrolase/deacetylase ChbG (UPF0249 family)